MKRHHAVCRLVICLALVMLMAGCTKVLVYGKDYETDPQVVYFENDFQSVWDAAQDTVELMGYEIAFAERDTGKITTGWVSTKTNSHYLRLFKHRDYGAADGAYYQVVIELEDEGRNVRTHVFTITKNLVGPLTSTGNEEKRILAQMDTFLRSPQIELDNVGMHKK